MMFGKKVVYVASTSFVLIAKRNFSNQNGELFRFTPSVTYLLNPFNKNVTVLLKRHKTENFNVIEIHGLYPYKTPPQKLMLKQSVFHDPIIIFP